MRRWSAVWTLKRGKLDPPEELTPESAAMADAAYFLDRTAERIIGERPTAYRPQDKVIQHIPA